MSSLKGKPFVGKRFDATGVKRSDETKRRMSEAMRGKKLSQEHREKIRDFLLGKTKEQSNAWKGENASYSAIHSWVKRNFGAPNNCESCNTITSGKRGTINWANISGKYIREREDWVRLCIKCHRKMDQKSYIGITRKRKHEIAY